MLHFAQSDSRGFVAELEALPQSEVADWLAELARFSREDRSSDAVASRLRSSPDPRAAELARWFEAPLGPDAP
jgi:hypothetical protein